jgi:alpha-tubulin suppressor-like RCC1 family protein
LAIVASACATKKPHPATSSFEPKVVPNVRHAVALATGSAHACAVVAGGIVVCWGNNAAGQIGDGSVGAPVGPTTVAGVSSATSVTAGYLHTCALLEAGTVMCWGDNHQGQLGTRTITASPTARAVFGVADAVAIVAGWAHTCALLGDGSARCWGNNDEGQLGNGTRQAVDGPVAVHRVADGRAIAAGVAHTCVVSQRGTATCWGTDAYGLPYGKSVSLRSTEPVAIAGVSGARAIAAGRNHTCALLGRGGVTCWGSNAAGQIGNRDGAVSPSVPVRVEGVDDAVGVAAGFFHTCARARDGSVRCWGANGANQLGAPKGRQALSVLPLPVSGDPRASTVTAGGVTTCALLESGRVACWGGNDFNQLGGLLGDVEPQS